MRFDSIIRSTLVAATLFGSVSLAHAGDEPKEGEEGKPFDTTYAKYDGFKPLRGDADLATWIVKYWDYPILAKPKLKEFDQVIGDEVDGDCLPGGTVSTAQWIPPSVNIKGFNLALPVFAVDCKYHIGISAGHGHLNAEAYLKLHHQLYNFPFEVAPYTNETYSIDASAGTTDDASSYDVTVVIFNDVVDDFGALESTSVRHARSWTFSEWVSWGLGQTILGQYVGVNFGASLEGGLSWDVKGSTTDSHAVATIRLKGSAQLDAIINNDSVGGTGIDLIEETLTAEARAYAKTDKNKKEVQLCVSGQGKSDGKAFHMKDVSIKVPFVGSFVLVHGTDGISLSKPLFDYPENCTIAIPYHL